MNRFICYFVCGHAHTNLSTDVLFIPLNILSHILQLEQGEIWAEIKPEHHFGTFIFIGRNIFSRMFTEFKLLILTDWSVY